MPKYTRQQWGRYDFTKEDVDRALLAAIDVGRFSGPTEVVTFGNGTAYIRGYVADLETECTE